MEGAVIGGFGREECRRARVWVRTIGEGETMKTGKMKIFRMCIAQYTDKT